MLFIHSPARVTRLSLRQVERWQTLPKHELEYRFSKNIGDGPRYRYDNGFSFMSPARDLVLCLPHDKFNDSNVMLMNEFSRLNKLILRCHE